MTKFQKDFKMPVYDFKGVQSDIVDLPKTIFNMPVNHNLITQAIHIYLYNQRQFTASAKTRGQVSGSTRKIYRQKGTGGARHGSVKAPVFVGGGVVFGPIPKVKKLIMPKKMRRKALYSSLAYKYKKGNFFIIDISKYQPKTSTINNFLNEFLKSNQTIFYVSPIEKDIIKYIRNIPNIVAIGIDSINSYSLIKFHNVVFSKNAFTDFIKNIK